MFDAVVLCSPSRTAELLRCLMVCGVFVLPGPKTQLNKVFGFFFRDLADCLV